MTGLSYDRRCAEIVPQAEALRAHLDGADLTVPVPTCPGWNAGQLVRHLGGGLRWAEEIVRTRATQPPPDTHFRDLSGYTDEDPAVVGPWLVEGAGLLADALRAAGPDAGVWTPIPGLGMGFWARRWAYETLVHRADAALALGAEFTAHADVAMDAIDEWMELDALPFHFEVNPGKRALLGPGRTLAFHATDPGHDAGWLVDLTGETIAWRRARQDAAVTVRAPLSTLLLLVYRRVPVSGAGIEVDGDAGLLDFWLDHVAFG